MSYYTRFADVEGLLTSTTTTVLSPTDNLLVFSNTDNKYHKTTMTAIAGGLGGQITTSTSTGTNIPAVSGTFMIQTPTSVEYSLSTPAFAGIVMTFVNSATSTSTWTAIRTESTAAVFFMNGAPNATSGGGVSLQFACAMQSATIVSGFSTTGAIGGSWQVIAHSTQVLST